MTAAELIEELTDICVRQAEIIKAQAFVIEQLGAQSQEDEALAAQLRELVGEQIGGCKKSPIKKQL